MRLMLMLPLYNALQNNSAPSSLDNAGNAGLWFERFFNVYPESGTTKADLNSEEKKELTKKEKGWLEKFCLHSIGDEDQLQHKALQQLTLIEALSGKAQVYKTQWHFVTGMGIPHPIENGFLWHPTLGVPYLPGSAVKGIIRAWLKSWGKDDDSQKQKEQLLTLFGSEDKDPPDQQAENQTGSLIFFNALPVSQVTLGIDVMTPHMGDWYVQGNTIEQLNESSKIPADWHDPVPVQYLVVKEADFLFTIAPRRKKSTTEAELELAMDALKNALCWLGAGAKTAVGYGLMEKNNFKTENLYKKIKEAERKLARISMTENQHAIDDFCKYCETRAEQLRGNKERLNTTIHNEARNLVKKAIEEAGWTAEEKHILADVIEEWLPKLIEIDLKNKKIRKNLNLAALRTE